MLRRADQGRKSGVYKGLLSAWSLIRSFIHSFSGFSPVCEPMIPTPELCPAFWVIVNKDLD